jgi:hypothetical protein
VLRCDSQSDSAISYPNTDPPYLLRALSSNPLRPAPCPAQAAGQIAETEIALLCAAGFMPLPGVPPSFADAPALSADALFQATSIAKSSLLSATVQLSATMSQKMPCPLCGTAIPFGAARVAHMRAACGALGRTPGALSIPRAAAVATGEAGIPPELHARRYLSAADEHTMDALETALREAGAAPAALTAVRVVRASARAPGGPLALPPRLLRVHAPSLSALHEHLVTPSFPSAALEKLMRPWLQLGSDTRPCGAPAWLSVAERGGAGGGELPLGDTTPLDACLRQLLAAALDDVCRATADAEARARADATSAGSAAAGADPASAPAPAPAPVPVPTLDLAEALSARVRAGALPGVVCTRPRHACVAHAAWDINLIDALDIEEIRLKNAVAAATAAKSSSK